ncbi:MAG TPA: TerC family protein [Gemmatimonadaceae bacterium]|nr:TerC family protein [Gemmatimonadaceae bacterium]
MSLLTSPDAWIGLLTLTVLEIVLGIDNVIFITILAGQVPPDRQSRARRIGLIGALVTRLMLLASVVWIARLTRPFFTAFGVEISGRSLILIGGGLFLIGKATFEIHDKIEEATKPAATERILKSVLAVVLQIMVIDIVFSLDSVITAVGMVESMWVMVTAILLALGVMLAAADRIAAVVDRHPSIKILALAFLVLIGTNLVAEGLGQHIPKGYTYFAMAFSFAVEMLNLRVRKPAPVRT